MFTCTDQIYDNSIQYSQLLGLILQLSNLLIAMSNQSVEDLVLLRLKCHFSFLFVTLQGGVKSLRVQWPHLLRCMVLKFTIDISCLYFTSNLRNLRKKKVAQTCANLLKLFTVNL